MPLSCVNRSGEDSVFETRPQAGWPASVQDTLAPAKIRFSTSPPQRVELALRKQAVQRAAGTGSASVPHRHGAASSGGACLQAASEPFKVSIYGWRSFILLLLVSNCTALWPADGVYMALDFF